MTAPRSYAEFDIGNRLRAVRVARRLSQRELARKSGVTSATISQIEQNNSSSSVASLKRILDAVPMSLAEFFSDTDPDPSKVFFTAAEFQELDPRRLFRNAAAVEGISLRQVGDSSFHRLQMLHETYPPGADTGEEMYSHEAEEAGIVISGQIEVTVGARTRLLGPGDGYAFDSRIPHRFRNNSEAPCVIVSACTPPSFQG